MSTQRQELVSGLAVGDTIAGKYEIRGLVGKGGIGCVLRAYHRGLDEPVAIKVLNADALRDAQMRERFQREARGAAKIKSDHIAQVFDVGTMAGDIPFLVMELLEGSDLAERVKHAGPLSVTEAARYVMQACEAIAEAHLLEIVHRDIKPENLFIAQRRHGGETIKVLDFGISKSLSQSAHSVTSTSASLGSPLYMSPEQLRSPKDVDHRTDIWSLGVSLHEITTGAPPFSSDTLAGLALKIVAEDMAPLSSHGPPIDLAFERVVRRCMAKAADDRYATVAELVRDLAPFCPSQGDVSVRRTAALLARSGDIAPSEESPFEKTVSLPMPVEAVRDATPTVAARNHASTVAWIDTPPTGDQPARLDASMSPMHSSTHGAFGVTGAAKKRAASSWVALGLAASLIVVVGIFWLRSPVETSLGSASSTATSTLPAPPPPQPTEVLDEPTASAQPAPTAEASAMPSAEPKGSRPNPIPAPWRPRPTKAKTPPQPTPTATSLYDTRKP